jgi:hypothetical protein
MKPILPIAALAALLLLPASSSAVTRGEVVKEADYPWFADALGCGGTLIAPDRVLTAAHCVLPLEGFDGIELTLGSSFEHGRRLKVRRHARDPRFQDIGPQLMARYDLAILELAEPVTDVEPLPVAERAPAAGTPAYIIGHGRRRWFGLDPDATPKRFRDGFSRPLVRGRQVIVSDAACRHYYAHNRFKRDFFDATDMICSLDPRSRRSTSPGAPWTSVCSGDSGGPLVAGGKLVGVVSWSEWCGVRHDPAVFARMPALRDFALGEPVWAPTAVELPTVTVSPSALTCNAPRFEGDAQVFGAVWTEIPASGDVLILPKETGLTLARLHAGSRYACAIRARNAGGSSRTPASVPVAAITGERPAYAG